MSALRRLAPLGAAALLAACGTTPPPLPEHDRAAPAAPRTGSLAPAPGADAVAGATPLAADAPLYEERDGKRVFRPCRDGEAIAPGLTVHLGGGGAPPGAAAFTVRNSGSADLPELLLQCVFAGPGAEGDLPFRPLFVSAEAPLRAGAERRVQVRVPEGADAAAGFRVAPGFPDILTTREESGPGTRFVGGRLECVYLDPGLTSEPPYLEVGLARAATAPLPGEDGLPSLEARLLLARAGRTVWAGPWIVVPSERGEAGERRIRWTLAGAPETVGCTPYLRVRVREGR
jgi:hypothetical protein